MSTNQSKDLPSILRLEGVNAKGFGIIPKIAIKDPDLSMMAKSVYCYLRSLTGRGETAFPSRDKILHDLNISKDAYYTALELLKKYGYITVHQQKTEKGAFAHNVYTIIDKPKKFFDKPAKENKDAYDLVRANGLTATGYGIIPYALMMDTRLPAKSKVLYGYVSAHKGAAPFADLQPSIIQYDLDINKKAYLSYVRSLKTYGYIETSRIVQNGRYSSVTRFSIIENPDEEKGQNAAQTIQFTNITKHESLQEKNFLPKTHKQDTVIPGTQNQDTEIPKTLHHDTVTPKTHKQDTEKQDTKKQDTTNQDATNNSLTSNSININNIYYHDIYIDSVREQIGYEFFKIGYYDQPEAMEVVDRLVAAICELYSSKTPRFKLNQVPMFTSYVVKIIKQATHMTAFMVVERLLTIPDILDRHPNYYITSLYNEIMNPQTISEDADGM